MKNVSYLLNIYFQCAVFVVDAFLWRPSVKLLSCEIQDSEEKFGASVQIEANKSEASRDKKETRGGNGGKTYTSDNSRLSNSLKISLYRLVSDLRCNFFTSGKRRTTRHYKYLTF